MAHNVETYGGWRLYRGYVLDGGYLIIHSLSLVLNI